MTIPDPRQIGCGGWTPPSQHAEEKADDRLARAACSARRYPSRRTFRITGAPECVQPTADDIRRLLNKARPDSEWIVQEIGENGAILSQNAGVLAHADEKLTDQ